MDSDYKVRLATLQAMGGDMTKDYPSVYDVDLAILSYVQQGGGGGGVSQEYVDQQDNAVKEWVASSYVSMADFEASELVTSKAINRLQTDKVDVGVAVSYTALSAMSYITAADLPDYSNTYQAKGSYVTTAEFEESELVTSKAINDLQSGKEDVGVCVSYTALSAMSYLTTEVDPIFTASPASGISREDLTKWNNTATYLNSYVSKSELDAAAYITSADLPDYSNTYQAKGDYVTPTDLNNAAYITNADVSAMSYATVSYVSTYFGRIVTLTQAQYDALQVKDPMTIYIISDAQ